MSKLTVLVFTILALINITVGLQRGERAKLIVELTQKIGQLQLNVTTSWLAESNLINDYKNELSSDIEIADNSVKTKLDNLKKIVKDAKIAAKEANKNINECVKVEEKDVRKNVTTKKIDDCVSKFPLEIVRAKLTELLSIQFKANVVIPNCGVRHPLNNGAFEECVLDDIKNLSDSLSSIKTDIDDQAKKIVQDSENCILTNVTTVNSAIDRIGQDFNDCVEATS